MTDMVDELAPVLHPDYDLCATCGGFRLMHDPYTGCDFEPLVVL